MSVTSSRSRLLEGRGRTQIALIIALNRPEGDRLTDELRHALKERARSGGARVYGAPPYQPGGCPETRCPQLPTGMVVEFHQATSGERHGANGRRETTGVFERSAGAVAISLDETVWLQRV